jgi:hypothetical protein
LKIIFLSDYFFHNFFYVLLWLWNMNNSIKVGWILIAFEAVLGLFVLILDFFSFEWKKVIIFLYKIFSFFDGFLLSIWWFLRGLGTWNMKRKLEFSVLEWFLSDCLFHNFVSGVAVKQETMWTSGYIFILPTPKFFSIKCLWVQSWI